MRFFKENRAVFAKLFAGMKCSTALLVTDDWLAGGGPAAVRPSEEIHV